MNDARGVHSHLTVEKSRGREVCQETYSAFLWFDVQGSAPGSFPLTSPALQRQRPAQQRGGLVLRFLCRIAFRQSLLRGAAPHLEILYEIQYQSSQRGDEQCDHAQPQRILRPEVQAESFTLRHCLHLKTVGDTASAHLRYKVAPQVHVVFSAKRRDEKMRAASHSC